MNSSNATLCAGHFRRIHPVACFVAALFVVGEGRAQEPPEARLSGELRRVLQQPASAPMYLSRSNLLIPRPDRLRVEVWTDGAESAGAIANQLRTEGADVELVVAHIVQATAPRETIWAVAGEPGVSRVGFVTFPKAHTTSEGVEMMGVPPAHALGSDGTGVHVLIVDGGFRDYQSLLGTELPDNVTTSSTSSQGFDDVGEDHGTACAEIVHDVAPGATLSFATAETTSEWIALLEWAAAQNDIDVVTMSVGWDDRYPLDGSSVVSRTITQVADSGKVVITSAGNEGDEFVVVPLADNNGNDLADLGTEDDRLEIYVASDDEIDVNVRWNEPFGAAGIDLDLCVLDSNYTEVVCSKDIQNGNDAPVDRVRQSNPANPGVHYVEVRCDPSVGCPNGFNLRLSSSNWRDWRLADLGIDHTRGNTISVPGDAERVLTVGAIGYMKYYRGVATYSSEGPTDDGRVKPEIFGPSHVSTHFRNATTGYGTGFTGTSAAAPHIAGLAAIIWQEHPQWTAAQVRDALVTGIDKDIEGRLFNSGLAYYNPDTIDCAEECMGRCGSYRGCMCEECPQGYACDGWNRCIAQQPEGGACTFNSTINADAGECRLGYVCLGQDESRGSCEYALDCTADSYWRNFDCVSGNCYRSYCFLLCDNDGACPAEYEVKRTSDDTCYCQPEFWNCVPDCWQRKCGPDACGGSCGECPDREVCSVMGKCGCPKDCTGLACGPDPVCGESCGDCPYNWSCEDGTCVCARDCSGRACGPDPACGESCGTCAPEKRCVSGSCQAEGEQDSGTGNPGGQADDGSPSSGCGCQTVGAFASTPMHLLWIAFSLCLLGFGRRRSCA